MDYITGLTLVFAGLLVGYFLRRRDPVEGDGQLRALQQDNEELLASLERSQRAHAKLDERYTRQQSRLLVLQQICDDWSSNRQQSTQEQADRDSELDELSVRCADLEHELQLQTQRCHQLEDQLRAEQQEHRQQSSQAEKRLQMGLTAAETRSSQLDADLQRATEQRDQLRTQLQQRDTELAEVRAELDAQQNLLELASRNAAGLEEEYTSLEAALHDRDEAIKQALSETAAARSTQQSLEESLAEAERDASRLREQHEQQQRRIAELDAAVGQVEALRESLQASVEQLNHVVAQRDQALDQQNELRKTVSGMQHRLDNQEATIVRLRGKHDEALSQLKDELDKREILEREQENALDELEDLLEEQVTARRQQQQALAQLTRQRDQFADQLREFEDETSQLLEAQTEALTQLTAQRDQFADQANRLEQELAVVVAQHQKKVDALVQEADEHRARHQELDVRSRTLAHQCDELTELCAELEAAREHHREQAALFDLQRTELETRVLVQNSQIEELHAQCREYQNELAADARSHQAEIAEAVATLTTERDELREQLQRSQHRTAEMGANMRQQQLELEEQASRIAELESLVQRVEDLDRLLRTRQQDQAPLQQELQHLRQQHADALTAARSAESLQTEMARQSHALQEQLQQSQQTAQQLTARLKASEETIRNLRRERSAVLARLASLKTVHEPDGAVISFTEAMQLERARGNEYDPEYGGPLRFHATRGWLYVEPPKQSDDLKQISGIAEVLEARLNDIGVYTFKQIMQWTPENIAEFSHLLSFKDRIERDDWVGQAQRCYQQKQDSGKSYAA